MPIPVVLRDYLDEHLMRLGRSDGLVFGLSAVLPFSPQQLVARADTAWKRAKLAITLHECRHPFASRMIAAGVNAALSTYVVHANIWITLDRYGHLMPGNEDEARGAPRRLPDSRSSGLGMRPRARQSPPDCASCAPVVSRSDRVRSDSVGRFSLQIAAIAQSPNRPPLLDRCGTDYIQGVSRSWLVIASRVTRPRRTFSATTPLPPGAAQRRRGSRGLRRVEAARLGCRAGLLGIARPRQPAPDPTCGYARFILWATER